MKVLAETVADVVGTQDPPAAVHIAVAEGHAAQVLLTAAAGADLLVVGSRGRGAFAGMLLGSVSRRCAQHAPCAVVVIPDGDSTTSYDAFIPGGAVYRGRWLEDAGNFRDRDAIDTWGTQIAAELSQANAR